MSQYTLPCAVATLLLLSVGCSAAPGSDPIASDDRVGQAAEPLRTMNPCNPKWQLPTADRGDPVDDEVFRAFEDELAAGGARWIGNTSLPDPQRAIVEVDTYASSTKKLLDSHLWFLAAVPIDSSSAIAAIDLYSKKPPVNAKVIGYCLGDKTFISLKTPVPVNQKIVSEITEYDPRCVCIVPDGLLVTVE